jgi:hypothetical protein
MTIILGLILVLSALWGAVALAVTAFTANRAQPHPPTLNRERMADSFEPASAPDQAIHRSPP